MTDELIDKVTEELASDIMEKEGQQAKVEPVSKAIEDMASLWKAITEKLVKDNICFLTKDKLGKNEPFDIIQVPSEKVEKGMIAFVCVASKNNTQEE